MTGQSTDTLCEQQQLYFPLHGSVPSLLLEHSNATSHPPSPLLQRHYLPAITLLIQGKAGGSLEVNENRTQAMLCFQIKNSPEKWQLCKITCKARRCSSSSPKPEQSCSTFAGIIPTEHEFKQQSNNLKINARGDVIHQIKMKSWEIITVKFYKMKMRKESYSSYTWVFFSFILRFVVPFTRSSSQCSHFFLAGPKKFRRPFVSADYTERFWAFIRSCFSTWYQTTLDNKVPKADLKDRSSTVPSHCGTKHVFGLST